MTTHWIVTCEHGGNEVPAPYRHLFRSAEGALDSHRGWDVGALAIWRSIVEGVDPRAAYHATTTRLLVDLNRSLHHPELFSEFTRPLSPEDRKEVLVRHYHPYRGAVEGEAESLLRRGATLIHIAVHTFTPFLDGAVRECDVGILYDPERRAERAFARAWKRSLAPDFHTRMNYPYRGTADGLTTHLRRRMERFGDRYVGIELEVNQALAVGAPERVRAIVEGLPKAIPGG